MGHIVAIGLRSICRISNDHMQEATGVEHRTESANCIDFHCAQGKGEKNETVRKNTKSLA